MQHADLANQWTSFNSLVPATRTATANGTGVDMNDHGPEVECLVSAGTVSGTSPTLDVKLQESDDNSTFTDITGATMTQITASTQIESKVFSNRSKRYVRAVGTIAGTNPSFACAVFLKARKKSY